MSPFHVTLMICPVLQMWYRFLWIRGVVDSSIIKPAGGKHAIEVMAIGVEWATPLGDDDLQELEAVYRSTPAMAEFLPSLMPVRALVFQVGLPGSFVPEDRSGGFDIRKFDPNGSVLWALSVRPELISCNCTAYDRWATVKPRAIDLLHPFLATAMDCGRQIKAVGLQYQDAFSIEGGIDNAVLRSLFRQDSSWLPPHLLEKPSLWHSHQGWFSISPKNRRVLNNVNLDFLEQTPNHLVRINGQHRVFSMTHDGKESLPIQQGDLEQVLDFLHAQNKEVLSGILSVEMLNRIGFDAGEKK